MDAIRLNNGHTLAVESAFVPSFLSMYLIVEFDSSGKRIWEWNSWCKSVPFIQPLEDNRLLISLKDVIVELDRATNKEVWRLGIGLSYGGAIR
ncbi:MAG: hypothetical protein AAF492_16475, partial [Verrucomicrobiota bacterium]